MEISGYLTVPGGRQLLVSEPTVVSCNFWITHLFTFCLKEYAHVCAFHPVSEPTHGQHVYLIILTTWNIRLYLWVLWDPIYTVTVASLCVVTQSRVSVFLVRRWKRCHIRSPTLAIEPYNKVTPNPWEYSSFAEPRGTQQSVQRPRSEIRQPMDAWEG